MIFDVNWNPTFDAQAQDRAYRFGQMREVRVYKLVSRGTIEELTLMRQLYKNKVTGSAIEAKQRKQGEYDDRRFKGVKGKRDGELFGLGNLLKYSEDSSFLNDILEAEGDEIDEDQLGEALREEGRCSRAGAHGPEGGGGSGEGGRGEGAVAVEKRSAKAPRKRPMTRPKAPWGDVGRGTFGAKAPMKATDDDDDAASAPGATSPSTASAPWGVTKDEADVKVDAGPARQGPARSSARCSRRLCGTVHPLHSPTCGGVLWR